MSANTIGSAGTGKSRRYALAGLVAVLGVLTGAILLDVLGTIMFALTVAYVLIPVHSWLVRRGFSEWTAAVAATLIGFVSVIAVFAPIVAALYFRIDEIIAAVSDLPEEIPVTAFDVTYTIETGEVQTAVIEFIGTIAVSFAAELPVLAIKFALFVILLFALLLKGGEAGRAAIAPVPHEYRDIVYALATRAREVLYAIYVLQLATSVATLLVGYPLFWLLGYEAAFTLALVAAILQFVPIIGPSLLIVPIAIYHITVGELLAAVLVAVLGITLVAWGPDIVVRPRLARRSVGLPGSLYFVGFTGGLFTLGAIGIVVGPLIVAVFVEAVELLADEVNNELTFAELAETDGNEPAAESTTAAADTDTTDGTPPAAPDPAPEQPATEE